MIAKIENSVSTYGNIYEHIENKLGLQKETIYTRAQVLCKHKL